MLKSQESAASAIVPVMLAVLVIGAVVFPPLSAFASPFVLPSLFLLLTFSLSLSTDQPLSVLTKPDPSVWGIMLWQMAFIPLLVILMGWTFGLAADLHLMVLATAVSGSVFAGPTIAHLLKVDSRLPINGVVLSTFLMPITLLVFGKALGGDGLDISISQYASRVGVFLLTPLLLSILINWMVKRLPAKSKEHAVGFLHIGAVASLLIFGVGIMDGVADKFHSDPERVITFLLLSLCFAFGAVIGTIALFWSVGWDLMVAAAILSVYRNVGLTYALIGTAAGHDFAIYVAISQIPMFLSPLLIYLLKMLGLSSRGAMNGKATDATQS